MFYRKDAVFMAVASILATAGFAVADNTAVKTPLTLDTVAVEPAPNGLLMQGLGKVGAGDTLNQYGLNIYGWVEGGYTYDHRHHKTVAPIAPGPFNHEFGGSGSTFESFSGGDRNHFMLNQVTIRFEKLVKADKWDVGGLIEVTYGTDAAAIHSNGFALGNDSNDGVGGTNFWGNGHVSDDRYNPQYQVDITQAYVDVNIPVAKGIKVRAGKFVTLFGYETIDPRGNPFYSHSYLFSAIPFTHTGIIGYYNINDQWAIAGGISRGWDQSLEDNNDCAIDTIGQLVFTPNKQWQAKLNWSVGPENDSDTSHYRTAIDGIVAWQATDKLLLGAEVLYVYDGGWNNFDGGATGGGTTHAYGDKWGIALYGSYVINDYVTFNTRAEKFHNNANSFDALLTQNTVDGTIAHATGEASGQPGTGDFNFYSLTMGVTVKPFPKDPIGKNLVIRPEVRYTYSEDKLFIESNGVFKDQLLFAADVIFGF